CTVILRLCILLGIRVYPGTPRFPTRRSSDLAPDRAVDRALGAQGAALPVALDRRRDRAPRGAGGGAAGFGPGPRRHAVRPDDGLDRKSTRLNSSHVKNSYAVFCLKKKKAY